MKKAIRNIQAILNKNGFDAGQPDGELGPEDRDGDEELPEVGRPVAPDRQGQRHLVKELLARNMPKN